MKTGRYVLYAGALAAVLVIALIASFQLRDNNLAAASPSPTASTTTSPAPTPTDTPTPIMPTPRFPSGTITGRIGYGSDHIPPVTVYAISTSDQRVWYSVDFAGLGNPPRPTARPGTPGDTYTITGMAPGTYWLVTYQNNGDDPPYPGWHSRQVECFRTRPSGPCPDVTLVPVTVLAGQTTSGIDVITWGSPPSGQPSPTFPPRPTPRP